MYHNPILNLTGYGSECYSWRRRKAEHSFREKTQLIRFKALTVCLPLWFWTISSLKSRRSVFLWRPSMFHGVEVGSYLCQRAGVCREQDCRLELRNPQMWLAPGGTEQCSLGIEPAPHSWGQGSRSNGYKEKYKKKERHKSKGHFHF